MTRVLAQAIVDPAADGWRVTVTGQHPHDQTRVYVLPAPSDNLAAQEGLRRFVEEMSAETS